MIEDEWYYNQHYYEGNRLRMHRDINFGVTGNVKLRKVHSHLTGCGDVDPGRHCGENPYLSRCSLSKRESPRDCPKPAILPLRMQTKTCYSPEYKMHAIHADDYDTEHSLQNVPTQHKMQTQVMVYVPTETKTQQQTGKEDRCTITVQAKS